MTNPRTPTFCPRMHDGPKDGPASHTPKPANRRAYRKSHVKHHNLTFSGSMQTLQTALFSACHQIWNMAKAARDDSQQLRRIAASLLMPLRSLASGRPYDRLLPGMQESRASCKMLWSICCRFFVHGSLPRPFRISRVFCASSVCLQFSGFCHRVSSHTLCRPYPDSSSRSILLFDQAPIGQKRPCTSCQILSMISPKMSYGGGRTCKEMWEDVSYFTIRTGTWDLCMTLLDTLPRNVSLAPLSPLAPITIMS